MSEKKPYIIIQASSLFELAEKVNRSMEDGYKPSGGLITFNSPKLEINFQSEPGSLIFAQAIHKVKTHKT
ncbi:MAG: DUF1737 domain-containing protein [Methyloprofundus sp.]|nr:DUF1737 domain-containing protein [Methyloprofundus sp.]